ncbi:MAG: carbohydrate ABC transporter permease [Lachnospiraceae bacterium]|nr:carbohydrate ABC transporter permease [Lachnospiraceae bacterium]
MKIKRDTFSRLLFGLIPFCFFILILLPVVWMVLSSFKETSEIFANLWALPEQWRFENYIEAWNTGISKYFLNSLIVTVATCLLNVTVCGLFAFALVVYEFKGKKMFHALVVGGLMFSPIVSLIPLYQELQALHLYDTRIALVLIYTAFQMPLCFMLTYNYFKDIDRAYVEAAQIDGCTSLQILTHVFMPVSKPIIMTTVVLTAFYSWNEFTFALIFLQNELKLTVPIGLLAFQGEMHAEWSVLLAGLTISAIPIIIFFIFTQKYFIAGLSAGGVKG